MGKNGLPEQEIATERLILRPWMESDAESLYKYASDPAIGNFFRVSKKTGRSSWNTAGKFVDGLMISGLYLKQLIRGTEYGEENVADGKRQDSILDIRFESVWRG